MAVAGSLGVSALADVLLEVYVLGGRGLGRISSFWNI